MASPSAGSKRPLEEDPHDTETLPPRKRTLTAKNLQSKLSDPSKSDQNQEDVPVPQVPGKKPEDSRKQLEPPVTDRKSQTESSSNEVSSEQRPPKRPANNEDTEAPRPRKRPGAAARISKEDKEAVLARQKQREEEALKAASVRGVQDAVRQHYNAVPQRGRDWRSTESRIKGLRKLNNWVKSTLIHRFSPPESPDAPPIRVLDLGCGKGGDLGKWQSAPHPVDIYIGIDPAEVSIEQARERYAEMSRGGGRGGRGGRGGYRGGRQQRSFDAEFIVQDAFGQSVSSIPIVRNVGFAEGGGSRWTGGGFDVVTMMFCMHYAFENEEKARGMLANVAGSLKKGGRFFGVIPNSDVIRSRVEAFHQAKAQRPSDQQGKPQEQDSGEPDALQSPSLNGDAPPDKVANLPSGKVRHDGGVENSQDYKAHAPEATTPQLKAKDRSISAPTPPETNGQPKANGQDCVEWGNSIYKVRFPGETPEDGIFRPPFGWRYNYFMEEAVEEVPEYVVPWEAFRALAEDYNLEQQYRKPFAEVWKEEKDHQFFGPLSERMGVRDHGKGPLLVSDEEMEAASFYHAFCFYKV